MSNTDKVDELRRQAAEGFERWWETTGFARATKPEARAAWIVAKLESLQSSDGATAGSGPHNIFEDEDHQRGCQGRTYTCTCGYDDRVIARGAELERQLSASGEKERAFIEDVKAWLRCTPGTVGYCDLRYTPGVIGLLGDDRSEYVGDEK